MTITFNEFKQTVRDRLPGMLPQGYGDCSIMIEPVTKTLESYTSLCVVREGTGLCRSVNLDRHYERYLSGVEMDSVIKDIVSEAVQETTDIPLDLSWITDYDAAKDRLFIRLSGCGNFENIRDCAPYRMLSDMVITYHILIRNDGKNIVSAMVNNGIALVWGITPRQLHDDAVANSPRIMPGRVETMEDMLSGLLGEEYPAPPKRGKGLMVITNETGIDGASALVYPGVMENAAEYFEGSYYVLPSSIHEVILMPEGFMTDPIRLNEMIGSINNAVVSPGDRLSYTAYRYDAEEKLFESVGEYCRRKAASRTEEPGPVSHKGI